MLKLYKFFTFFSWPFLMGYMTLRIRKGKEDPTRFSERKGISSIKRPKGKLLWMHGASVWGKPFHAALNPAP